MTTGLVAGTVREFSDDRGCGFITPDSGGKEVFVHISAVNGSGRKTLKAGQRVTYEVVQGKKGPQANNVTPL